jgi:hypothetical protein
LHRGEFCIAQLQTAAAYKVAGLSYDTKFDLKQIVDLPYNRDWFSVPPAAPHGQVPKLGILHASLMRTLQAAFRAATDSAS